MGLASARSFAGVVAILNDAANVSKKATKAADKSRGNVIDDNVKSVGRVALRGDSVKQGVTGDNVLYILGFSLLGAVTGLAIVAIVAGVMLPG